MNEYETLRHTWIENGRQCVLRGEHYPLNHKDQGDLIKYRTIQRERVSQRGMCESKCRCELVENTSGQMVCPYTWRQCPSRSLVSIVSLLERVNS
jgi:hypothetical protein